MRRAWVAVLFGVLVTALLRDGVLFGRVFYVRDIHLQWYGQVESFVRAVMAGAWPLWDPYVSFGQPMLANANAQTLYPPTWLNLLARPWTYYTFYFAGHLVLAGVGAYALARRFGVSTIGSLVAGAAWILSGPLLSLGNAWNHLAAAAWMPWCLVATDAALEAPTVRRTLLWGAAMAMPVLCGSPDVLAMTAAIVGLLVLSRIATWPASPAILGRVALATAGAAVVTLGLAAGQLLPSLDLAARSNRWGLSLAERTYWSIHPWGLLQLAVPVFWSDLAFSDAARHALFESREPFLLSLYMGVPLLALALAGLVAGQPRVRWLLGAVAAGATLVALGRHAPFYAAAVQVFTPLRVLRFPAKAMVPVALCLSLLAGMGFDAWRDAGRGLQVLWRAAVAIPVALVAGFAALAALAFHSRPDTWGPLFLVPAGGEWPYARLLAPAITRLGWTAAAATIVLVLATLGRRAPGGAAAAALVVAAIAIADLAWTHRDLNPTAPTDLFRLRPEVVDVVAQKDHGRLFVYDYMVEGRSRKYLGRDAPYVVPGVYRDAPYAWAADYAMRLYLVPPTGAAWGLYGSYGRNALGIQPTPVAELNALLQYAEGTPGFARLLRLGAVNQVLALHTEGLLGLVEERTFTGPFAEPIRLFRVPDPLPRSYVVSGVRVADGARAREVLLDPAFDPATEVLLPSGAARAAETGPAGTSRILEARYDGYRLEAEAPRSAHLVFVESYDPGWRATVDGYEAAVLRANTAFCAIPLAPGRHQVELRYRPRSVPIGLALSAATLLVGVLLFARSRPGGAVA